MKEQKGDQKEMMSNSLKRMWWCHAKDSQYVDTRHNVNGQSKEHDTLGWVDQIDTIITIVYPAQQSTIANNYGADI